METGRMSKPGGTGAPSIGSGKTDPCVQEKDAFFLGDSHPESQFSAPGVILSISLLFNGLSGLLQSGPKDRHKIVKRDGEAGRKPRLAQRFPA
jgi:hypothetical protein